MIYQYPPPRPHKRGEGRMIYQHPPILVKGPGEASEGGLIFCLLTDALALREERQKVKIKRQKHRTLVVTPNP
jgi:hypothetical protein